MQRRRRLGGTAAFIDAEHALDPVYAKALGVDIDSLLVSQPDTGEQGLDIAEALVRSGAIDIVVIDSVAALVPQAPRLKAIWATPFVGSAGPPDVARHCASWPVSISKSQRVPPSLSTSCVRRSALCYGNPEVTTGGRALKFYASVRMEVRRIEHLKDGTELIGSHTRVKVVKNKVAPPFKQAEFDIMYGEGISRTSELVDLGVEFGILNKSGAWFSMGDTRLGQGRDAAKQYFKDHPDIADDVQKQIMKKVAEERSKLAQSHAARPSAAVPTEKAEKPADKAPRPSSSKAVSIDADDFDDLDEE